MKRKLGNLFLWILGWEILGYYPITTPTGIIVVAPHTSWTDFFMGIFIRMSLNLRIMFLAKKSLFNFPLGIVMRWLGGYKVDRSVSQNLVENVSNSFKTGEIRYLALSPEGTRKKVSSFKTGFYYISKDANVPLILLQLDYKNKKAVIKKPFYPTNDKTSDFDMIYEYFDGVEGKHPELSFTFQKD